MLNYIKTEKEIEILKLRKEDLKEEMAVIDKLLEQKKYSLKQMDYLLKEYPEVENKLLYQILVKNLNPTQAIRRVSYEVDKDESTLWKNYYPKVKESLKELEKSIECLVTTP